LIDGFSTGFLQRVATVKNFFFASLSLGKLRMKRVVGGCVNRLVDASVRGIG
jgi:hypothetical protein